MYTRSFYAHRSQKRKMADDLIVIFALLKSSIDFINILRAAFTPVAPKSVRLQSSRQYLFTHLGSTSVNVER